VPQTNPSLLPWSDEPDPKWNQEAANAFTARVMPDGFDATEIVLEGKCPRCRHQTVSTHPVRSVMSDQEARERAAADGCPAGARNGLRRVTAQCRCRHNHPDTPDSEDGCGAPFALWVYWAREDEKGRGRDAKQWPARATSLLDLEEEIALQRSASSQLADVRRSAESWRTGLAGFLAILIAIFFIRGKDSFDDIRGGGWKALLAALLLFAAGSALYGAYRALRAAYGVPRDEYLGEVTGMFRLIPDALRTTPRDIHDYGTVSAWQHAFARQAVADLRHAKVATVVSVIAVASAAAVTWFAPG
jgi:hypothetical protein